MVMRGDAGMIIRGGIGMVGRGARLSVMRAARGCHAAAVAHRRGMGAVSFLAR
jgi:hypothetical protein